MCLMIEHVHCSYVRTYMTSEFTVSVIELFCHHIYIMPCWLLASQFLIQDLSAHHQATCLLLPYCKSVYIYFHVCLAFFLVHISFFPHSPYSNLPYLFSHTVFLHHTHLFYSLFFVLTFLCCSHHTNHLLFFILVSFTRTRPHYTPAPCVWVSAPGITRPKIH